MNRITVKQIFRDEICLEDIRRFFLESGIKTLADFREKKASGELQVPSRDNLNALCKEKKGKSFEMFFFGNTKSKLETETNLIACEMTKIFDENCINTLLEWCIDNRISTKNEYIRKKPVYFPSPGNTRQLAGKAGYLKEILNIDFKN